MSKAKIIFDASAYILWLEDSYGMEEDSLRSKSQIVVSSLVQGLKPEFERMLLEKIKECTTEL